MTGKIYFFCLKVDSQGRDGRLMNQLKLWIFCLYPNILKHKGTETEETVNLNFSQYFLICTIISSLLLLVFFRRNWRSSPEIFCLLPVAPIGAGLRRICKQGRGQQVSASRGLREEMKISVLKRNEVSLVSQYLLLNGSCQIVTSNVLLHPPSNLSGIV